MMKKCIVIMLMFSGMAYATTDVDSSRFYNFSKEDEGACIIHQKGTEITKCEDNKEEMSIQKKDIMKNLPTESHEYSISHDMGDHKITDGQNGTVTVQPSVTVPQH